MKYTTVRPDGPNGEDCIVSRRRFTRPTHNATLTFTKRANDLFRSIKYYS